MESQDQFIDGSMAVIENPIFTDFAFNKANRCNEEINI